MLHALALMEMDGTELRPTALAAAACAAQMAAAGSGDWDVLVLGSNCQPALNALQRMGAKTVLVGQHPSLEPATSERYAAILQQTMHARGYTHLLAAASTFSKDILPRTAALLDAPMVSDATGVFLQDGEWTYERPMYAGNVIARVRVEHPRAVLTVRASSFKPLKPQGTPGTHSLPSPIHALEIAYDSLPSFTQVLSKERRSSSRPDPSEARIVVSGGRAIRTSEDFERIVGGLADALGGAVGSSRALVDSGITPNSLQVGQTGKVVAPDIYFALGISGAIQHMAGMKDSKVIVAINRDPDAPIFEVADYGLVGDVYQVVPELIARIRNGR